MKDKSFEFSLKVNRDLLQNGRLTIPNTHVKYWTKDNLGLTTIKISLPAEHPDVSLNNQAFTATIVGVVREYELVGTIPNVELVDIYSAIQLNFYDNLTYILTQLFADSYIRLQTIGKKEDIKTDECINIKFDYADKTFYIIGAKQKVNEYTAYFRQLAKYKESIKELSDKEKYSSLVEYTHDWTPVSEFINADVEPIEQENCVYMWRDDNCHRLYVGKAKKLYKRLNEHWNIMKNPDKCVKTYGEIVKMTHYRFDRFYPYVNKDFLTALEYRTIRTVASILENKSGTINGDDKITPAIEDTKWKMVNKSYNHKKPSPLKLTSK